MWQCQRNNVKDASATRAMMPAQRRQRCQHDKGNKPSATPKNMPAKWRPICQPKDGNDVNAWMAKTPVQRERWVTMPAQLWQRRQQGDGNQRQHCTGRQRRKHNKGDDANATRATIPAQLWRRCQCTDGNDTSARRVTMPALGQQRCQCNKGDDTSETTANMLARQGQWCQLKEGNDTGVMRATTPDWCWQRLQCNAGGGIGATRKTTPAQQSHNFIFCCHYCRLHATMEEAVLSHPSVPSDTEEFGAKLLSWCYLQLPPPLHIDCCFCAAMAKSLAESCLSWVVSLYSMHVYDEQVSGIELTDSFYYGM